MILKTFSGSFILTAIALVIAFFYGNWAAVGLTAILILIEVVLSFDNAVVNARVLENMNAFWRRMFLTVGILIAVVGVRFLLPIVLVSLTTQINPVDIVKLAFENGDPETPGTYGYYVTAAHPQLAAASGMFLLMLFFSWLFGEKEHPWLYHIEHHFARLNKFNNLPAILSSIVLVVVGVMNPEHTVEILIAGIIGLGAYLFIDMLSSVFDPDDLEEGGVDLAHKVGAVSFLYLEFLDASFSMDSLGAGLAITPNILILILGLGVGAIYVRSMTIYLVNRGALAEFRYMESGAMWAIGSLTVILFLSISHHISEMVTGGISIGIILIAIICSIYVNKKHGKHESVIGKGETA